VPGAGFDIDFFQRGWVSEKDWVGFQNHVMLIQPAIDGGDLTLTKGVIEGVVNNCGRYTKARSGVAVDDDILLKTAGLLVAADVAEVAIAAQLLQQSSRVIVELLQ